MAVEKIVFKGLDSSTKMSQTKRNRKEAIKYSEMDEKQSNSAKYMLGATALAGVIALGIIGHKNNWGSKVSKAINKLVKENSGMQKNAENKISNLAEEIDYSDFTKIRGKNFKRKNKNWINELNEEGKIIRTFKSDDGKTLESVLDYDPSNGQLVKRTVFRNNGKSIREINYYDKSTHRPLQTFIYDNNGILESIQELDPFIGSEVRIINYKNGKIDCIENYCTPSGIPYTVHYNHDNIIEKVEKL